ncbi:MAG: ABC transporter permease [Lachnospiraceae bacterium]|nr:ABC transporter permease [Lachnospiraceae bacterium]
MIKIVEYFKTNGGEYLGILGEHLRISIFVILIAMIIAIPLGIVSSRYQKLRIFFERFFGLLRIVPSLAILIICIPIIGTGVKPTVIALTILAIPPILINTAQAFINLPQPIIEAAVAMGMSNSSVFFKVKLPLAFPLMFAGIRTATVEVIASATLASYIGAGGLGDIIFTGLALLRMDLLLIGGGSVAILSLVIGFLLDSFYSYMTKYQRL